MRLGKTVMFSLMMVSAQGLTAPDVDVGLKQQAPSFIELDRDGDGLVAKVEVERVPRLVPRFDNWDRDKDGQLSRAEYRNGLLGRASK